MVEPRELVLWGHALITLAVFALAATQPIGEAVAVAVSWIIINHIVPHNT